MSLIRLLISCLALSAALLGQNTAQAPLSRTLLTTNAAQDHILLINSHTGQQRSFSLGDGIHTAWGFSPDGCQFLATLTNQAGLARAYLVNLDGSQLRPLVAYTELPDNQWGVWSPVWSPTGDKIAFTLLRDGLSGYTERAYHIAWVSPDNTEPSFYSVTGREHSPTWSPDGNRLAYISYDLRPPGDSPSATASPEIATVTPPSSYIAEADLWVVNADGTGKFRATTFETGSVRAPRWSPDGQYLSFVMSPSPANDTLWVMRASAGAPPIQVTYRYNLTLDHTWMPDGSALLVSARAVNDTRTSALWVFPPTEGADSQVTSYHNTPYPDYPAFSPDGSLLALRSEYRAGLLSPDGIFTPFEGAHGNMPLHWSPISSADEVSCTS